MRLFTILVSLLAACGGPSTGTPPGDDGVDVVDAAAASRCVQTPSAPGDPLTIVTEAGEVRGAAAGETRAFLGIPYAAAERFQAPAEPTCWEGVRAAAAFGNACPQLLPSGSRLGDEDCLFANVWTPTAAGEPRPVLVFIHGGAYEIGSGNQDLVLDGTGNLYDGRTLAEQQGAVIVTFNYRLGELGFLAHPAFEQAGNFGTLDQIAALRWVRDNIGAFGGDRERVMIFGESAGGLSVCLLLATPLARGLFHAAAIESGGCKVATRESRFAQGTRVAERLGCDGADPAACLRGRDAFDFVGQVAWEAAGWIGTDPARMWEMLHGPTLDDHVFVEEPAVTLREGRHAKVPLVVGSNADEFAIFAPPMLGCGEYFAFVAGIFGTRADEVIAEYPCLASGGPHAAAVAVMTDHMFTCEARRTARAATAGGSPVYRYLFTRTFANHALAALDSFHTAELPFVFQTFAVLGYTPSAGDAALARELGGYWARLAATGSPDGAGVTAWPLHDATDPALVLDMPLQATAGIRTDRCDFWDALVGAP